jgi:hypothetical protein
MANGHPSVLSFACRLQPTNPWLPHQHLCANPTNSLFRAKFITDITFPSPPLEVVMMAFLLLYVPLLPFSGYIQVFFLGFNHE